MVGRTLSPSSFTEIHSDHDVPLDVTRQDRGLGVRDTVSSMPSYRRENDALEKN